MKPRKHVELIKAWADGAQIQAYSGGYWTDVEPTWNEVDQYRLKPEKPEPVYPTTMMSEEEIQAAWGEPYGWKGLCTFANAALRHAIDNGQVQLPGDRAARDMAIAEAVSVATYNASHSGGRKAFCDLELDLATIIAKVQA